MYILLEGIDRAGKSTQIGMLQKKFPDALFTKEPGATALGKKIRELILHTPQHSKQAELFLFLADRSEHIQKVIKPNLNRLIISDRGYISGIAYASLSTHLDLLTLEKLNHIALDGIYPQKIILLELSKEELKRRFPLQNLDTIEKRGVEYLLKVQDLMRELVRKSSCESLIIDAALSKQQIFEKIVTFIKDAL